MNTIPEDLLKKVEWPSILARENFAVPPMYTWPRFLKQVILFGAIVITVLAYILLAGGLLGGLLLVLKAIAR